MACAVQACLIAALWSVVVLMRAAQAMKYTVGGPAGWVVGSDMESWAAEYTFHVGDELYFPYPYGQSSVELVTEEDFTDCNTNDGVASDGGLGDMVMTLVSPQTYFFISGHADQCKLGLRLKVPVLEAPPPPGAANLPTSSIYAPPPPADEEEDHTPPASTNIPSSPVILSPPRSINTPYSNFRSSSPPISSLLLSTLAPLALALTSYLAF